MNLRRAFFLDRDGTLNVDVGYAHRVDQLRWIEGAREAVRAINNAGLLAIVVTNQSGIARGYYSEADMHGFHAAMQADLATSGAHIDAWYHCPFHSEGAVEAFVHPDHPDRKPNPGMILRAIAEHAIDPATSHLAGDHVRDVEAARRAGVAGHLFTGGSLLDLVGPLLQR